MSDLRFRDVLRKYLPPWLAERRTSGRTFGYRYLWSLVAPLDAAAEVLFQGFRARFPGIGTTTALPLIGRSRGIIRGQDESVADYTARLVAWLDTWPEAGWEERSARAVHEFIRGRPRVRVVSRAGRWITVNADGSVERHVAAWDWDSVSHPERSGWWSDLWMVVYVGSSDGWEIRSGGLEDLTGDDGHAIGHMPTHEDVDAVKGLLSQWKGAHSRFRAVIFTTDAALFDPEDPDTCPDGTWGSWGRLDGDSYVLARDTTTCRYWEPR